MDDVITRLIQCSEYDELTKQLCDQRIISVVRDAYQSCNPRVLLSAFLICKHPDMVFASQELLRESVVIVEDMRAGRDISPSHSFFSTFSRWKEDDSEKLQMEISSGITMLEDLKVETQDEADEQWNEGIDTSIEVMRRCKAQLESYDSPS